MWETLTSIVKEFEKKMLAEKKKLLTFIAGVRNATADVKSKTERIQIIVKAAVHHLDMKGVRWEEARDKVRYSGKSGNTIYWLIV